jgi:hypothetical protein
VSASVPAASARDRWAAEKSGISLAHYVEAVEHVTLDMLSACSMQQLRFIAITYGTRR